jgi:hypothetical protein
MSPNSVAAPNLRAAVPAPARPCGGCGGGGCGGECGDDRGLERVRFFPRQLLGADDLNAEQHYFREKQRRHNRYLHGWGVVCGAEVRPAPTATRPYQVMICPGYVITPRGDEIMIGAPALFDLATCVVDSDDPCAFARPCPPVTTHTPLRTVVYLSVCYRECEVRPVRVSPGGCNCDDTACDYSRIRDAYEFACLDSPPQVQTYDCGSLCRGEIQPCPACATSDCVVLATVRLRGQITPGTTPSGAEYLLNPGTAPMAIDNLTHRKMLYSTAMLQSMAMCQCGGQTPVANQVPAPTFVTDHVEHTTMVTIQDAMSQATIHYTVDGSEPTTASPVYHQALEFAGTASTPGTVPTVKAFATAPGCTDSDVATFVVPES